MPRFCDYVFSDDGQSDAVDAEEEDFAGPVEEVCPECGSNSLGLDQLGGGRSARNDCGCDFSESGDEWCCNADVDADDGSHDSDEESCPECNDVGGVHTECKGCGRNRNGLRF